MALEEASGDLDDLPAVSADGVLRWAIVRELERQYPGAAERIRADIEGETMRNMVVPLRGAKVAPVAARCFRQALTWISLAASVAQPPPLKRKKKRG